MKIRDIFLAVICFLPLLGWAQSGSDQGSAVPVPGQTNTAKPAVYDHAAEMRAMRRAMIRLQKELAQPPVKRSSLGKPAAPKKAKHKEE